MGVAGTGATEGTGRASGAVAGSGTSTVRAGEGACRRYRLWGCPARAPAGVCNAQPTLHHFQLRVVHAADACEPALP